MSEHLLSTVSQNTGFLILQRPTALNSLSLEMVRALTQSLLKWRDDTQITAVVIQSSSEKAFCAGGDIRFFYQNGIATVTDGSALIEDFFNEEYALNHLIHHYPKPYIALLDGVVMGGGMGIAQAGPQARMRIVTERTKMAMPEVAIGLFPDVGGSYFLSRAPGEIGTYLGVTGQTIGAADAIYADLADLFVPSAALPSLQALLTATPGRDLRTAIVTAATTVDIAQCPLALSRAAIDMHFAHGSVAAIMASLASDSSEFASKALAAMQMRSPLMMSVTLEQIRRGAKLNFADCLRMERTMVRRCFEHGEVIEGVRALVIDKDHAPRWNPAQLEQVTSSMVEAFFEPAWPAYAHPLRDLN